MGALRLAYHSRLTVGTHSHLYISGRGMVIVTNTKEIISRLVPHYVLFLLHLAIELCRPKVGAAASDPPAGGSLTVSSYHVVGGGGTNGTGNDGVR